MCSRSSLARSDAISRAPDGAVVALSRGEHRGNLMVTRPVTLWGACTSGTTIRGPNEDDATGAVGTLVLRSAAVAIRNLRVTGDCAGILVGDGDATVEDIGFDDVIFVGVGATRVTVRGCVVRGVREPLEVGGYGIDARRGAQVVLEDVSIGHARGGF